MDVTDLLDFRMEDSPECSQHCIPERKFFLWGIIETQRNDTAESYFLRLVSICIYRDTSLYSISDVCNYIATFKIISGFTIILGIFYFDNSSIAAAEGKPVWVR